MGWSTLKMTTKIFFCIFLRNAAVWLNWCQVREVTQGDSCPESVCVCACDGRQKYYGVEGILNKDCSINIKTRRGGGEPGDRIIITRHVHARTWARTCACGLRVAQSPKLCHSTAHKLTITNLHFDFNFWFLLLTFFVEAPFGSIITHTVKYFNIEDARTPSIVYRYRTRI